MAELSSPAAVEIGTAATWVRKCSSPWVRGPLWDGFWIFGALATQLRTSSWVPALLALGFATGFIHYRLDRSVYRISDPQVRAAARGLLDNTSRVSRRRSICELALVLVAALSFVSSVHAQTQTSATDQQPPNAIYTPRPVYRPEWEKQGLTGKGVVLVTIDQQTGRVTGARML
ncbi:MAG: hypothetical protein DMG97_34550 [Acidobacteria bacterium]|nr:MAG: hypothetical protein DMG97_34550 [Acidobacteriota bacterium]